MHSVYVFDAYGTLFDTGAAVARHAGDLGDQGKTLTEIWRRKQLEYSWVRALTGVHDRDFWQLTEDALDFAFDAIPALDPAMKPKLLEAYRDLDCYPDAVPALKALREAGARLAILSNGSRKMLERAAHSAGIDHLFDAIVSADEAKSYKTAPQVYDLVTTAFRIYPDAVSFQSSNRWDIAGATRFGFHTVWINRTGAPDEYHDMPPARVLPDLSGLGV